MSPWPTDNRRPVAIQNSLSFRSSTNQAVRINFHANQDDTNARPIRATVTERACCALSSTVLATPPPNEATLSNANAPGIYVPSSGQPWTCQRRSGLTLTSKEAEDGCESPPASRCVIYFPSSARCDCVNADRVPSLMILSLYIGASYHKSA